MQGAAITLIDPNTEFLDVLATSRIDEIFNFLSGAEAGAVRGRLAKPENQRINGSEQSQKEAAPAPIPEGDHFPQVTSEGAFEDTKKRKCQSSGARGGAMPPCC